MKQHDKVWAKRAWVHWQQSYKYKGDGGMNMARDAYQNVIRNMKIEF
jgi:hypothetical protein